MVWLGKTVYIILHMRKSDMLMMDGIQRKYCVTDYISMFVR